MAQIVDTSNSDNDSNLPLKGKHVVVGITAGIAAYKAPILVRQLRAGGAEVQVVMSHNASQFVTATSLQAVAGTPVRQDLWDVEAEAAMGHIELARWADCIVVAPATANSIAKLVNGFADDLLTTLCLATDAPVVVAPAMNQQMYAHPATQTNLARLHDIGYQVIGPDSGEQACGDFGPGRMSEPETIAEFIQALLSGAPISGVPGDPSVQARQQPQLLRGKTVMITTGPTMEAIDPVRYISNHSSGVQGVSLAQASIAAGAQVILIAGPRVPECLGLTQRIDVKSALQMEQAVQENLAAVDIFIGVAAVADYRPAQQADQKMKRSGEPGAALTIALVENPDIIAGVAASKPKPIVIGFAAETNNTLEHARAKRIRKGLDAIVLNDVSDPTIGFNNSHNAATLISEAGEVTFPRQSKRALADAIIDQLPVIFAQRLVGTNPATVTK